MTLEDKDLQRLLTWIAATRDDEIGCDEALPALAARAAHEAQGTLPEPATARAARHLADCPECAEEYEALVSVLRSGAR
jgi:hypothetical protein